MQSCWTSSFILHFSFKNRIWKEWNTSRVQSHQSEGSSSTGFLRDFFGFHDNGDWCMEGLMTGYFQNLCGWTQGSVLSGPSESPPKIRDEHKHLVHRLDLCHCFPPIKRIKRNLKLARKLTGSWSFKLPLNCFSLTYWCVDVGFSVSGPHLFIRPEFRSPGTKRHTCDWVHGRSKRSTQRVLTKEAAENYCWWWRWTRKLFGSMKTCVKGTQKQCCLENDDSSIAVDMWMCCCPEFHMCAHCWNDAAALWFD